MQQSLLSRLRQHLCPTEKFVVLVLLGSLQQQPCVGLVLSLSCSSTKVPVGHAKQVLHQAWPSRDRRVQWMSKDPSWSGVGDNLLQPRATCNTEKIALYTSTPFNGLCKYLCLTCLLERVDDLSRDNYIYTYSHARPKPQHMNNLPLLVTGSLSSNSQLRKIMR